MVRFSSAKDDAAGQAIANRMTAQITGLSQAQRNANDGISVAQTAEGALNQVNDNLQRIRELSVQAQNGTNSQDDLTSIQDEINQRLDEIDRVSKETSFNGVKVLAEDQELKIQVGANDGETITVNLSKINAETLKLGSFSVSGDQKATAEQLVKDFGGQLQSATYKNASLGQDRYVNSDGDVFTDAAYTSTNQVFVNTDGELTTTGTNTSIAADYATNGFTYSDVTGSTSPWTAGTGENAPDASGNGTYSLSVDGKTFTAEVSGSADATNSTSSATVTIRDANGNVFNNDLFKDGEGNFTVKATNREATAADLESEGFKVSTASYTVGSDSYTLNDTGDLTNASNEVIYASKDDEGNSILVAEKDAAKSTESPLKALDDALKQVDSLRSELGAVQNRFDSAITNLSTTETNLSAARSRIEDADYATEVANMTPRSDNPTSWDLSPRAGQSGTAGRTVSAGLILSIAVHAVTGGASALPLSEQALILRPVFLWKQFMLDISERISARDLVYDIIPKLKATENLVNNTLQEMITQASDESERNRHHLLQQEFELELMMINMNLDHLLKRYAQVIQAVAESGGNNAGAILELDQHERLAIDSAKKLYERARAIQAGK